MNGIACPTSLYLTLSAESQSPTPRDVNSASIKKIARARTPKLGKVRYQIIIPMNRTKETAKSATGDKTPETGSRSLGKYIFEMSCAFPTTLLPPRLRQLAKRFQGNRAEKMKIG